ncbi:MAG: hypothetical protein JW787_01485 [Sedimentisphaerales bacterium]|nr:hypothetical protein [Sedimentisphaerales bacterium]
MNLPNIKDILKIVLEKLSVLKNNLSVMISIIIALVGILLFVPSQLLSRSLKKEVQQKSIDELANKLEDLKKNLVAPEYLEEVKNTVDSIAKDANTIELLSKQTTQRELLRYDIFNLDVNDPNRTVSQTVFTEFGREYCGRIDKFIGEHNANICPTSPEIETELKLSGIESMMQGGGRLMGRTYVERQSEENYQGIIADEICWKRAKKTFVYIDPMQISGYDFWSQYSYSSWIEDIENCWYSQLGYWVIEDVFDTIVAMNTGHESLVTAPVKRLMKINFSDGLSSSILGRTAVNPVKVYSDRPQYIRSNDEVPRETMTGRYSDEYYDVIHFKATFVISSKDVMRFIQQLCSEKEHKYIDKDKQTHTYKHNQITILDTSIKSVDMRIDEHDLYRYGDENVSEVELSCEYIFNVKGYDDIMPQSIKDMFGGE